MSNLTEEQKKLILRCYNINIKAGSVSYILSIPVEAVEYCYSKWTEYCRYNNKLWAENFWDLYKVV